jgi:ABC-type antimicrobial peptide transport system permease subunit
VQKHRYDRKMSTSLNKPTETNPLRQNDERYVLVSQEFPQQEDGIDLADLAIAAWKNRFLFIVSWVILAVITFGVLQTFNTATISTEIRSGLISKAPIQSLDAIKDQLTTVFFPLVMQDLEKQLQHQISGKITTDVKKGSDYIKTSIVLGGLSGDQVETCLKSVMQKWVEYQTAEIKKSTQTTQDRIALLTQEIASTKVYSDSLQASSDPQKQSDSARLILQVESKKQQIFDLQQLIQNVEQPIVITPFDYADSGPGRGIKGMAVSAFTGAVLAFCLVFAASIIRTAKARLANS